MQIERERQEREEEEQRRNAVDAIDFTKVNFHAAMAGDEEALEMIDRYMEMEKLGEALDDADTATS